MTAAHYSVVFDGGALGNPGRGYGSYHITAQDGAVIHERLEYGDRVTNNQAEYRTLIEALEALSRRHGGDPSATTLQIRGDSQLVINQVLGRWKVKHPDLQPLHQRAVQLLAAFGRVDLEWHPRAMSVRLLGH